jgi:hypothetical protein
MELSNQAKIQSSTPKLQPCKLQIQIQMPTAMQSPKFIPYPRLEDQQKKSSAIYQFFLKVFKDFQVFLGSFMLIVFQLVSLLWIGEIQVARLSCRECQAVFSRNLFKIGC